EAEDFPAYARPLRLQRLFVGHVEEPGGGERVPAEGMALKEDAALPVPLGRLHDDARAWLSASRLEPAPVEGKRSLVEDLEEAFVPALGELQGPAFQLAVGQGDSAIAPIRPEEESVARLPNRDLARGERLAAGCDGDRRRRPPVGQDRLVQLL